MAVFVELEKAEGGTDFARLAWLVEDLIYDDLLKGTGWGRRRGWCRERLEECRTLAQARALCQACASGFRKCGTPRSLHRHEMHSVPVLGLPYTTPGVCAWLQAAKSLESGNRPSSAQSAQTHSA